MPPELWSLYALMLESRLSEEAIAALWHDGLISGEMHLGTGEEAIIAGVVSQLRKGDAMALDHRGTAALLMRGVDPVLILRELLGYPDGLYRNWFCTVGAILTSWCNRRCVFRRGGNEPRNVDGIAEPGFGLESARVVCLQG